MADNGEDHMDEADSSSDSYVELLEINYPTETIFHYESVYSGLLKAVNDNNLVEVKDYVAKGYSVNLNDNNGNTALHLSAAKNLPEIIEYLIEEDAPLNVQNFYGQTPLNRAVEYGHFNIVKQLLEAGADANICNNEQVSPLHFAANQPEIAQVLLEHNANVNAVDSDGETPLHQAVGTENLESVAMFLYYNADANIKDLNGLTPFMLSVVNHSHEIQTELFEYVVDFNDTENSGIPILALAMRSQSLFVAKIIERGADVNYVHEDYNIFEVFCQSPRLSIFKIIWPELRYQDLGPDRDHWTSVIELDGRHYVPSYLKVVIDSGNVQPFMALNGNIPDISKLLLARKLVLGMYEDIVTELILLFLTKNAILRGDHITDIYYAYGFNELIGYLLYQDIKLAEQVIEFPYLLFDFRITTKEHLRLLFLKSRNGAYRPGTLEFYCPFFNISLESNNDGTLVAAKPQTSLLELTRNETRDALLSQYQLNTARKFYTFIKQLDMPSEVKEVFLLKKPLHKPLHRPSYYISYPENP